MHEVSICQSILSTLETELDASEHVYVREIHVKIGLLSYIEPTLLKHAFQYIKEDTPFQDAELFIEMVDITAECEHCGHVFKVEKYKFICPVCHQPVSRILEGKELHINKIILKVPDYEEIKQ